MENFKKVTEIMDDIISVKDGSARRLEELKAEESACEDAMEVSCYDCQLRLSCKIQSWIQEEIQDEAEKINDLEEELANL